MNVSQESTLYIANYCVCCAKLQSHFEGEPCTPEWQNPPHKPIVLAECVCSHLRSQRLALLVFHLYTCTE